MELHGKSVEHEGVDVQSSGQVKVKHVSLHGRKDCQVTYKDTWYYRFICELQIILEKYVLACCKSHTYILQKNTANSFADCSVIHF